MSDLATQLASSPFSLGGIKVASISIKPQPGRDRSSGTWKLLCMWDDGPALHTFMQGGPVTTTPAGGGTPTPTYNPTLSLPGWPSMLYTGANLDGIPGPEGIVIDNATGKINYKYAEYSANFETQNWGFDPDNGNRGNPQMQAGVEIFTPQGDVMQWADGSPMDAQPTISYPLLNVSVPMYNMPLVNFSVLTNALVNPLNSGAMPYFGGVGPKKVRYNGSGTTWRTVSPNPVVDMLHHFSIRGVGWDKELRPGAGSSASAFQTYQRKGGGDAIGSSDLNALLT